MRIWNTFPEYRSSLIEFLQWWVKHLSKLIESEKTKPQLPDYPQEPSSSNGNGNGNGEGQGEAPAASVVKSHLLEYPCPSTISFLYNFGFLAGTGIIIQMVTGLILALHYVSDICYSYYSIFFLIREVYYGWCLRYFHSSGASFVFLFVFIHVLRGFTYGSYFYNTITWLSGIVVFFFLMAIAFIGYVLPFGQMSFWGATVITNLLSPFPEVVEWVCGGYTINVATLKRFFLFHFILPFVLSGLAFVHLFYLHFHSSSNHFRINFKNKTHFFPFILKKDFFGLVIVFLGIYLQTNFGFSTLSHPDNALEVSRLTTPLHIVPEWYFLCQYALLKAVPNKNAGFIVLLTSILFVIFLAEVRNLTTLVQFPFISIHSVITSLFFITFFILLLIGAQFPQDKFLSYARILTAIYYLLLISFILN